MSGVPSPIPNLSRLRQQPSVMWRRAVFSFVQFFNLQQLRLHIQTAGIPYQAAALTNDAMTGNDDRDWIDMICHAYCPRSPGRTDSLRDIRICACLPIWYPNERLPYIFLKFSSFRHQRDIKPAPRPGKILIQLTCCLVKHRIAAAIIINAAKYYAHETAIPCAQSQPAYWRINIQR